MENAIDTKKQRLSNLELLRLISIYGIILMHECGSFFSSATGVDRILILIINSFFNMGVSIFMLISGFFRINFSKKKFISLIITVYFYSVLSGSFKIYITNQINRRTLFEMIFPIFVNKYWYITVYIILFLLSKWINKAIDYLEKKDFRIVILVLFVFFVLSPTLLQYQILNDCGKGLINMFLMYLVGAYIQKYNFSLSKKKSLVLMFLCTFFSFSLNLLLTVYKGNGVKINFSYDNSFFIFFGSIFCFILFLHIPFYSKLINISAKAVFSVYLFEGTLRDVINSYCKNIMTVQKHPYIYIGVLPIIVIFTMILVEGFRLKIFFRLVENISNRGLK